MGFGNFYYVYLTRSSPLNHGIAGTCGPQLEELLPRALPIISLIVVMGPIKPFGEVDVPQVARL